MEKPKRFAAKITHDCGQKLEIPITDIEEPFVCTGCGKTDRIEPENVQLVRAEAGHALMKADAVRKATGEESTAEWDVKNKRFI